MKYQDAQKIVKAQEYMMQVRPIFQKEALFSDGTKDYRIPTEPKENETVMIKFRTAKDNVDGVWLCTDDEAYLMEFLESDGIFDYYAAEFTLGTIKFSYCFEIVSGLLKC